MVLVGCEVYGISIYLLRVIYIFNFNAIIELA